jgi:K+-sensing histidine kinase KdpD
MVDPREMSHNPVSTYFAPPGRSNEEDLQLQVDKLINNPIVDVILNSVNSYVMILNENRQVLAVNPEVLEALNVQNPACLIGLRPGEAFHCNYYPQGPGGCGTATHCQTCGAVISILESQNSQSSSSHECRLSIKKNGMRKAVEFYVRSTPLEIDGEKLTIVVLRDVSSLKRREILERVFFHDVLNTLGGIKAWTMRLKKNADPILSAEKIVQLSARVVDEINEHRTLLYAEEGQLEINKSDVEIESILQDMKNMFEGHEVAESKTFRIINKGTAAPLHTDRVILLRILGNMVKNAFEASLIDGQVTLTYEHKENRHFFYVQNDTVIPPEIKPHIFERSFSTKANHGRGIGTYSMKLFGEQFLGGTVEFTSEVGKGTTFLIALD